MTYQKVCTILMTVALIYAVAVYGGLALIYGTLILFSPHPPEVAPPGNRGRASSLKAQPTIKEAARALLQETTQ